jgi:fatty-acyl-CoA synthase
MLGMMQEWPLLCHKVIDHAAIYHGQREVVSRSVEGPFHRTNYAEIRARSLKLAQRLERDGCGVGDRIATMAWNTWRHLETWYGILGIGAVYHTLNPRLFPDQIAWIMNDAEDKMLFVDLTFVKLVEMIAPKVPSLERVVILTDDAHMPETALKNAVSYESYGSRKPTAISHGRSSTNGRRPGCATRPAPRVIPRACSIRTAPTFCMRWQRFSRTCSTSRPGTG